MAQTQSTFKEDVAQDTVIAKFTQTNTSNSPLKSKFQESIADNSLTQIDTSSAGTLPRETNSSVEENAMAQVTSVSQLSDVQPTDWAFQALQSLVERYGVIAGYPDSTFRGNRALTRYEFAAGLNAPLWIGSTN